MKLVTIVAEFEVPDGVTKDQLEEFFEFELGYRCVLSGENPMAERDMPKAKAVYVRDW